MNTSVIYQVNITDDYPYLKAANLQNIKGEIELAHNSSHQ